MVAGRRLDLHNVGAEIAEQHRAVGAGQRMGEVQDADAVERQWSQSVLDCHLSRLDGVSNGASCIMAAMVSGAL
jgi:hypothetical protein